MSGKSRLLKHVLKLFLLGHFFDPDSAVKSKMKSPFGRKMLGLLTRVQLSKSLDQGSPRKVDKNGRMQLLKWSHGRGACMVWYFCLHKWLICYGQLV